MKIEATESELKTLAQLIANEPAEPPLPAETELKLNVARKDAEYFELIAAECATIICFRHPRKLDNYVANLPHTIVQNEYFEQALSSVRDRLEEMQANKPKASPQRVWKVSWTLIAPLPGRGEQDCCKWFTDESEAASYYRQLLTIENATNIDRIETDASDPEYLNRDKAGE